MEKKLFFALLAGVLLACAVTFSLNGGTASVYQSLHLLAQDDSNTNTSIYDNASVAGSTTNAAGQTAPDGSTIIDPDSTLDEPDPVPEPAPTSSTEPIPTTTTTSGSTNGEIGPAGTVTTTDGSSTSGAGSDAAGATNTTGVSPIISGVKVVLLAPRRVQIRWETDIESSSSVLYGGATGVYKQGASDRCSSTLYSRSHCVVVDVPAFNTVYYFRVVSVDPAGARSTSREGSFRSGSDASATATSADGSTKTTNVSSTAVPPPPADEPVMVGTTAADQTTDQSSAAPPPPSDTNDGPVTSTSNLRPADTSITAIPPRYPPTAPDNRISTLQALYNDIAQCQTREECARLCRATDNIERCKEFVLEKIPDRAIESLRERIGARVTLDTDEDGITDYDERTIYHTDPEKADTDGDGINDGDELKARTNPRRAPTLTEVVTSATTSATTSPASASDHITFEDPRQGEVGTPDIVRALDIARVPTTTPGGATTSRIALTGTAPPNAYVTVYVFSNPIIVTVKTGPDGVWKFELDEELADGSHQVYAAITDGAGSIVAKGPVLPFTQTAEAVVIGALSAEPLAQSPTSPVERFIAGSPVLFGGIVIGLLLILVAILGLMRTPSPVAIRSEVSVEGDQPTTSSNTAPPEKQNTP